MSFLPTVRELHERELERWSTLQTLKQKRNQVIEYRQRIEVFREVFPDTVSPNALARFLLAKEATGARLNRLIPAWAKPAPIPKARAFVPGTPPQFQAPLRPSHRFDLV